MERRTARRNSPACRFDIEEREVLRALDVALVGGSWTTLAAERIARLTRRALPTRIARRLTVGAGSETDFPIALEPLGIGLVAALLETSGPIGAARLATATADGGHVLAIAAH